MNKHFATPLTLLALALNCGFALGAPMGCLIEPERSTDVGSPVVGVIERIDVERGQTVRRGQIVAVLRADVERATLDAANSRADGDADLKAAAASAALCVPKTCSASSSSRNKRWSKRAPRCSSPTRSSRKRKSSAW